jgi:FrmR/RcnR family transcriptional regulator, repressor of frmRAB operon
MAHTQKSKQKLLQRTRRIRGQINAVETALTKGEDCSVVLHNLSACRGAINSLMAEVLEGHVREHVIDRRRKPTNEQIEAAEEVISIVKSYLK